MNPEAIDSTFLEKSELVDTTQQLHAQSSAW